MRAWWMVLISVAVMVGCTPEPVDETSYSVYVTVDNLERTFLVDEPMTVEDFLAEAAITYDDNDRLVPPSYTQVTDGTRITIVRVEEEESCETEVLPYEDEFRSVEGLEPGEERIQQQGQNGEQRICYRIVYENGVQQQRLPIGQPEIIEEPVNQIIAIGVDNSVEPIPIVGTLSYLSSGNAWIIRGNSTDKRPLTVTGDLDSLVLSLSLDGNYLMYTRDAEDSESFVNELWIIDTSNPDNNVQLSITDVLHAEWVNADDYTISYTTGEIRNEFPGWGALNNLWLSRIDPAEGTAFNPRLIVEENSGGLLGWWGTVYSWSPDGTTLAWARANGTGVFDQTAQRIALADYEIFSTNADWSWRTRISWSWDGDLLASVIHGPPQPGVPAETSPIFSIVVMDRNGNFVTTLVENSGMWAAPQFSPQVPTPDNPFPTGYIAYLLARDPLNRTINTDYDLVVADRDGSNARMVFPPEGQPGIRSTDFGLTPQDFVWSPDGRQIAVVYQGDLYIVDVVTGANYRMTFDGNAEHPVWVP